ncbi:MAG: hypothetical protein RL701_2881 [Pseudomonadota bacterium]|jgi:DNA-binding transcriptional LysR family regulator
MTDQRNKGNNADSLGLDHMRAFIAVIETGTQAQAAKRLELEQATVSRHVARVQEHFGGGLFLAGASGPLSTRGSLVEQSLRAALAELTRTRERLAMERPVLRIGYMRLLRPLIETALRSHVKAHDIPDYQVRLQEQLTEPPALALMRRELDIAIDYASPELAEKAGIEESIITEQPFALVVPAHAWSKGKLLIHNLAPLLYASLPARYVGTATDTWLAENQLVPAHTVECEWATEIIAYAASGYGFGFLPALWSMVSHEGAVFVPLPSLMLKAKIAAYSLQHLTPWITRLREDLSAAARAALHKIQNQ